MSRCDLDFWPLDLELLQHFDCHLFKLCTKFERNRVIYGRVIDDLARFRNFRGWNTCTELFSQLHQTWQKYRAIIPTQEVCFRSQILYLAAFSNACRSKLSDILNDAKFCTLTIVWGGVGEISMPIVEAAERGWLMKKVHGYSFRS